MRVGGLVTPTVSQGLGQEPVGNIVYLPVFDHLLDAHTRMEYCTVTDAWSPDELERIGRTDELQIATNRADGTLRREVPVWVVGVIGQVYVRTWSRRHTGWFGHAVDSRRARIGVPGLAVDIAVEDVGDDKAEVRLAVDAAYRAKYGRYGPTSVDRMVTDDAAASTLRLIPLRRSVDLSGW
jgi:hypothetical protein